MFKFYFAKICEKGNGMIHACTQIGGRVVHCCIQLLWTFSSILKTVDEMGENYNRVPFFLLFLNNA